MISEVNVVNLVSPLLPSAFPVIDTVTPSVSREPIDNPYRYAGYEYIEEVKLYDLNARYYNPEIARFLSQDLYYNLGNRVIGLYEINVPDFRSIMQATVLYAYCGNCPIVFFDFTGLNSGSEFQNSDGTYSLYDNDRFGNKNAWHEQLFVITPSGPSWDLENGSVGLGSVEGDVFTGGWEWEHADLSLFDLGHAEAGLEIKDGAIDIGAQASIWSPSASVTVGGVKTEVGIEVGAIGLSAKGSWNVNSKGFEIYIAFGLGIKLSVSW